MSEPMAAPQNEQDFREGSGSSVAATGAGGFVVGRFYMVPCVRIEKGGHPASDAKGWIPIHGPEHHDREVIGFNAMHFHIDVRFLGVRELRRAYSPFRGGEAPAQLLGFPVSTHSDGKGDYPPLKVERELRRKRCHRDMPDFPRELAHKWLPLLEEKHRDCKLKPGLICPHRGFSLAEHVKQDGTVICPGHGLRWNATTGELITDDASGSPSRTDAGQMNKPTAGDSQ